MDREYTLDQYLDEEYNYKWRTTPTDPAPIQLAIQTCNCKRCIPFGKVKKCEQKYETMSQRLADKLSEVKKEAKKHSQKLPKLYWISATTLKKNARQTRKICANVQFPCSSTKWKKT